MIKLMQPLQQDGRIDNLEVVTQQSQRGGVAFGVNFLDRQKNEDVLVTVPVGAR